jgi:hypothetical protein
VCGSCRRPAQRCFARHSRRSWMERLRRHPTRSGKAAASASTSVVERRRRPAASRERPTNSSPA